MNTGHIYVSRDAAALGLWTLDEVLQLMTDGFLLTTDLYSFDGSTGWKTLDELPKATPQAAKSVASRVGKLLQTSVQSVQQTARRAAELATGTAEQQRKNATLAVEHLLKDSLPKLGVHARKALASTSQSVDSALRDEELLRKVFGAVYDVLPRPVYRFLDETAFVEFCLKHRLRLLREEPTVEPEADSP